MEGVLLSITIQQAKKMVNALQIEFNLTRRDLDKEANYWVNALEEYGIDDQEADKLFAIWKRHMPDSARPTLHQFRNFCHDNTPKRHYGLSAGYTEPCRWCQDSGYMPILLAMYPTKRGLYAPDDMVPGEAYGKSRTYQQSVACVCSKGKDLPIDRELLDMREYVVEWMKREGGLLAHKLSEWQRACMAKMRETVYETKPTVTTGKLPPGDPRAKDAIARIKGRLSRFPGGDVADRERKAELLDQVRDILERPDESLEGFDDVPDDLIPF